MTSQQRLAALIATLTEIAGAALAAAEDSATCDDALAALEVIESRCRVATMEHYGHQQRTYKSPLEEVGAPLVVAAGPADYSDVPF